MLASSCFRRQTVKRLKLNGTVKDPDIEVGAYLTLERADGRSLWKQRFVVTAKGKSYTLEPVDEFHGYL